MRNGNKDRIVLGNGCIEAIAHCLLLWSYERGSPKKIKIPRRLFMKHVRIVAEIIK